MRKVVGCGLRFYPSDQPANHSVEVDDLACVPECLFAAEVAVFPVHRLIRLIRSARSRSLSFSAYLTSLEKMHAL
jgi:hypothetical protein